MLGIGMQMNGYEWTMMAFGGFGLVITLGTIVVSVTRGVAKIGQQADQKYVELEIKITQKIEQSRVVQDDIFREVATGLRKFIEKVEAEMHQIEMWGRDHYVQKEDFGRAVDKLEDSIKELALGIKDDFRELYRNLQAKKNDGGSTK